jgi:hypothetical protein
MTGEDGISLRQVTVTLLYVALDEWLDTDDERSLFAVISGTLGSLQETMAAFPVAAPSAPGPEAQSGGVSLARATPANSSRSATGSLIAAGANPVRSSSPRMMSPPRELANADIVSAKLCGSSPAARLASTSSNSTPASRNLVTISATSTRASCDQAKRTYQELTKVMVSRW